MQSKTSSDELLRELGSAVLPPDDAAHARIRRERIVENLAAFVEGTPSKIDRRRRFVRMTTMASAAALVLIAGLAATRLRSSGMFSGASAPEGAEPSAVLALEGPVHIVRSPSNSIASAAPRVSVGSDDEVITAADGRARARLASGAEVDIDPESRVRLVGGHTGSPARTRASEERNEAIVLGTGRVTLRVPKLGPMRSLSVRTAEATVVVHGTAFSVARLTLPGEAVPRTTVGVTEGSVAVRHDDTEILLQAGDRWTSGSSPSQEFEAAAKVDPGANTPDRGSNRSKSNAPAQRSPRGDDPDKRSSLATENRLLQAAMAARQQGDARRATQLANELLARFPASPLVEEARVERMRAVASTGGTAAAAAEARSYLGDYPQGFARQEANRILASAPR